jgi:HEPN domain-containing protein
MMSKQEKFDYYLKRSQYDLNAAEVMLKTGYRLYVAFMCQQAIEKLVTGLYTFFIDDNFPRIHEIQKIFKAFENKLSEPVNEEQYKFMSELSLFYIASRYVDYKQNINKLLTKKKAEELLAQTKELCSWLVTLKP